MEAQAASQSRPARVRTAKACRLCNEKRVKCDASERGTPCTRCEKRGEPDCTLIQSRRGIYIRKPRRQRESTRSTTTGLDEPNAPQEPEVQLAEKEHNVQIPTPASELPRTRPPTASAGTLPEHSTPSGATDISAGSRQRDASWSAVFEGLLQRHQNSEAVVDKCSIAYVGEAFPLGIILDGSRGGTGRPVLHHSGPLPTSGMTTMSPDTAHPTDLPPEDIAFLDAKHAFSAPSEETLDALVSVFIDKFVPLYPVVNPQEFLHHHRTRKIPWILLHSVCFVSATFCPLRILHRAGFDNRKQARSLFYNKAKALFDVAYENSKIVTLQVSILLSFWGGSPNNHWNFYTWISTGVTIAETIGCHRSMAGLNIKSQDRSLLKRLWWILIVRDATCAAMHGRPFRINLDHCDVDELTMEDFMYDTTDLPNTQPPDHARLSGSYQIQSAKLALLLRTIVTARFYPRSPCATSPSELHAMLIHWRNELPASLQWNDNDPTHTELFRTTLRILYNHNVILSYIKPELAADDSNAPSPSTWLGDEVVGVSAEQIASVACSMITNSEDLVPPHELFHGVFMACVVFFVQTRSGNSMTASLGRSGLTNCKMVLYAHRNTWDASSWITQLFDKAVARPTTDTNAAMRAEATANESFMNQSSAFNSLDVPDIDNVFFDGFERWPSHLFLGDLFDPSLNTTAFVPPASGYETNISEAAAMRNEEASYTYS